jgi:sugar/nucleoside kinase (ribokinase family)
MADTKTLVFCGLTTLDVAQLAGRLPLPGEKGTSTAAYMDVGGPAANAAIAAAGLGSGVLLQTVVGSGDLADYCRRVLARHQVRLSDHAPDADVPLASIWIDAGSGGRTILATNNAHLRIEAVGPLLPDSTAAVLIDGHYPELAVAVAGTAWAADIPIVLDCGRWRPVYAELLPVAAGIIMCETFRPPGLEELTAEQAATAIYDRWGPDLCAVTRGPDDVLAIDQDGLHTVPVPPVQAVDTTGAGDVLHGAYMHYRHAAGLGRIAALQAAAEIASESCTHLGVRLANRG